MCVPIKENIRKCDFHSLDVDLTDLSRCMPIKLMHLHFDTLVSISLCGFQLKNILGNVISIH